LGRPTWANPRLRSRRRKAITDGRPGSTRDRNYAQCSWQGAGFELIDTGGLLFGSDDPLLGPAAEQAERAIDESDLVVLVVDARNGLLPDDRAISAKLRATGRRVIVAVNKTEAGDQGAPEFTRLGWSVQPDLGGARHRGRRPARRVAAVARGARGRGARPPLAPVRPNGNPP
jgi:GTP-binding protein